MDSKQFYCPKCHMIEDHDHDSCDGNPHIIATRWYTHKELIDLTNKRKKKVYYVRTTTRPNTR
jgi:hypothetical protein